MQKITLIGRPNVLTRLPGGTVFAVPRAGPPLIGIRVAGADDAVAWACLDDADTARRFGVERTPPADAAAVFAFPTAGTVIDPRSLVPVAGAGLRPGMLVMTRSHLLMVVQGGDALVIDLESGALRPRPDEPAAVACRWQIVVPGHGDATAPVVTVEVTPG